MFIDLFGFFDELDSRYYCCVTGKNRSGKDLISVAIARRYLDKGYRLLHNKPSVWSDDWLFDTSPSEIIGPDGTTDIVFIFSEGGWNFRTMDSYREVLITIGMLNNRLLIPSRTLPHEDMQQFLLYPARGTKYNPWFQVWQYQIYDWGSEKPVVRPLFFLFPRLYLGVYQTGGYPSRSTRLYSWFASLNAYYQAESGASANSVQDLARPGQGLATTSSSLTQRLIATGVNRQASATGPARRKQ